GQDEPVEPISGKSQQVIEVTHRRKQAAPPKFDGNSPLVAREIELDGLRRARKVEYAEDRSAFVLAQIGQDLAVARIEELQRAEAESPLVLADRERALGPA